MPWIESPADATLVPSRSHYREAPRRPGAQSRFVYDGGVYDSAGQPMARALHVGGNTLNCPAPSLPEGPTDMLAGTWMFGGWLRQHFGHFLNESLGRLWAWPEAGEAPVGIIFLPFGWRQGLDNPIRSSGPADKVWLPEMLRLLGIPAHIHMVTAPVRVERLILPTQRMLVPTPEDPEGPRIHQAALRRAVSSMRRSSVSPIRRGYISRGGMQPPKASFILESIIEANLARDGYAILYPEAMTLEEQIATYAGLEEVVAAEGSALHLAAPFLPDQARLAMFWRFGIPHPSMLRQLGVTSLPPVRDVSAVAGVVVSMHETTPEDSLASAQWRNAHAVPDFEQLGMALRKEGFIGADSWTVPPAAMVAAAIQERLTLLRQAKPQQRHAYIPAGEMPLAWRAKILAGPNGRRSREPGQAERALPGAAHANRTTLLSGR